MATINELPSKADLAAAMDEIDKAISIAVDALIPVGYPVGFAARHALDEMSDDVPTFDELGRLMAFAIGAKSRLEEAVQHVDGIQEHLSDLLMLGFDVSKKEARS